MKRFFSTSAGRLTAIGVVALVLFGIKLLYDLLAPSFIIRAVSASHLGETTPAALVLPWYFAGASANGIAYVNQAKAGGRQVFLLGTIDGESKYHGTIVLQKPEPISAVNACTNAAPCTDAIGPKSHDDDTPVRQRFFIVSQVRPGQFEVAN